ncbi:hypothetical protein CDD82_6396 [Ophiocordyceps australis]|uniref:Oxidoreductase n=1 Tax=Ophiocordyceps australis TaxID=1399860 RepID=A0A2C5YX67_9HYPO|nr:hypothetical protein CDD82_6396 [Ophiocordyceps australis]
MFLFGNKGVEFSPQKDIPSLKGKVIVVTGGSNGLGKQAILEYARHEPKQIWLAARDPTKAKTALDQIKNQVPNASIKTVQLDLASFDSVVTAAKTVIAESDRLDILMLNAGIMATSPDLTKDGYEMQFGTNHMGHALLTKLLLPLLDKTAKTGADVRVAVLSSTAHGMGPRQGIVFDSLKTKAGDMGAMQRYGQSKFANVLFARQLAKLRPSLTVAAIHPGVVTTNLLAGSTALWEPVRWGIGLLAYTPLLVTVETGVKGQLWATVSNDVKSGEYYEPIGVGGKAIALANDDDLAKKLWDWTETELNAYIH